MYIFVIRKYKSYDKFGQLIKHKNKAFSVLDLINTPKTYIAVGTTRYTFNVLSMIIIV